MFLSIFVDKREGFEVLIHLISTIIKENNVKNEKQIQFQDLFFLLHQLQKQEQLFLLMYQGSIFLQLIYVLTILFLLLFQQNFYLGLVNLFYKSLLAINFILFIDEY